MIAPTIGRIVWFYDNENPLDALAAIVVHVWNDRMVNLTVFSREGTPFAQTSVRLLQDDDLSSGESFWCAWMPYQKSQAAKYEALEKEVKR